MNGNPQMTLAEIGLLHEAIHILFHGAPVVIGEGTNETIEDARGLVMETIHEVHGRGGRYEEKTRPNRK